MSQTVLRGLFRSAAVATVVVACRRDTPLGAAAPLTALRIDPPQVTIAPSQVIRFSGTGIDAAGDSMPVALRWTATGGTIDAGGTYTAGGTAGTYHVVATDTAATVADTAPVTITASPLAQIVLVPATAVLAPGASRQFTAYGKTAAGDSVAITVSFAATGGTVSDAGLYVAGQNTGTFPVIATSTTTPLADTSFVTVQPAPLAQLILVPAVAAIAAGGSVQFQAYGRTAAGDSVAAAASYAATGGSVSTTGLYTAGATPGTFQVTATQTGGSLVDTSVVTITAQATCVSTATMLCPGDGIQAKASAAGLGATLTLQPGTYRMQTVTPLGGQHFVGQPGAVMSGAALLTGWVPNGATWYVTGQTQRFADNVGVCGAARPTCQYQEDVYRDNVLLTRVLSLAAVAPGTFYFDYTAQRIYVGDDPAGHVLEGAAVEYAFQGNAQGAGAGVTIQGLTIEKYANPAQTGAVGHTSPADNWVISGNEIRYNHGYGVIIGHPGVQVLDNYIHHNGQLGIGGGGAALIQGNEVAYNNTAGFEPSWEAGGIKFTGQAGMTATGETARNNFVHHNHGRGLWADTNHDGSIWDGNTVEDNDWDGLVYEISYSATITNNVVNRNGAGNPNTYEGAGITIYSSGGSGITISGNTLSGNKNGIILIQASRGSGTLGSHVTQNVNVHDNTVTLGPTQHYGAVLYGGDTGLWSTLNNHFTHNTYNLQTADQAPFQWANAGQTSAVAMTDAEWRSAGNDGSGIFNR